MDFNFKTELKNIFREVFINLYGLLRARAVLRKIKDLPFDCVYFFLKGYSNEPRLMMILFDGDISKFLLMTETIEGRFGIKFKRDYQIGERDLDYIEARQDYKGIEVIIKLRNPSGCHIEYEEKTVRIPKLDPLCEENLKGEGL